MNADFPRSILFPVLRAGLERSDTLPALDEDALRQLIAVAARQSILPVVLHALQRCSAPVAQVEAVNSACESALFHFLQQDETFAQICACFTQAEIPFLPLKGAELRALYPEPWLRTGSDLDILVQPETLERAIEVLERKTVLCEVERAHHDVSLLGGGVHLELHFLLHGGTPALDALLSEVWVHAAAVDGFRWRMEPEYELLYVLAHASRHLRRQGIGIRPLIDVYLLRKARVYDEEKLRILLEQGGLWQFCEAVRDLTAVWFDGAAHTQLTEKFEAFCLEGGVFGSTESSVYVRQRAAGTGDHLARRLLLPRAQLEEYYPALREKPGRLPYYQVKRWFHAATRDRKRIANEQKIAKAGAERAAAVDALMQELGF